MHACADLQNILACVNYKVLEQLLIKCIKFFYGIIKSNCLYLYACIVSLKIPIISTYNKHILI